MAESQKSIKPISELKTAAALSEWFAIVKRAREKQEKDWKLNLAFYNDNQYCWIAKSGRLEQLGTEEGEKPRHRVRITANKIKPGAQSLLSKLTKTKPVMTATPASASDSDIKGAQMSEQLLEHLWVTMDLADKLEEALLWGMIGGQGYWKITWDSKAGVPMTFTIDPFSGQVITDDSLVELFKGQLEQMGLDREFSDQTVYLGDIRVDVLSPFQVWVDPTARTFSEAKYVICEHSLTPEEIKARWGKEIQADSVPADPAQTLPFNTSGQDSSTPTVKKVYFGYFKPQPGLDTGRYVVWVEGGESDSPQRSTAGRENKHDIFEDTKYPYELPIVKFPGVRVPGQVYDSALITTARPLQKELNRTLSQIIQYKNLTIKPRVWAPIGSLTQRLTDEPGAMYEFQPIAGLRPEIEQLPAMPPYVFEHLADVSGRLNDVFMQNEVSEGTVPPNVEAGVAIDLLQEMSTDRVAPTIRLIESALAKSGKLMLMLAQRYYVEPRMLRIHGTGGSMQIKRFKGADLASGVDVIAESGSGLPRTRAGRQARIESFIDRGVLMPHQAYKYFDLADMKTVAMKFAQHEDKAYREHDKMLKGMPLNTLALQNATRAVMQGMNPISGEPIQDESEIQSILMEAMLQPTPADDHAAHLDCHGSFINSVEFENLPPEIQQLFVQHFLMHQQELDANKSPAEPIAPRVSLSLKGTAGATATSDILQASGVNVTPEELANEEPLATSVYDSMDKADKDTAGNDPLSEQDMAITQQEHEMEMALEVAKAAREDRKAATQAATAEADSLRADEKAAHEMAIAEEKLEIEREKARRPSGGTSS